MWSSAEVDIPFLLYCFLAGIILQPDKQLSNLEDLIVEQALILFGTMFLWIVGFVAWLRLVWWVGRGARAMERIAKAMEDRERRG